RHVQSGGVVLLHPDVVHQAEVDHVDAEFGIDDVAHGLLDVVDRRHVRTRGGRLGQPLDATLNVLGHVGVVAHRSTFLTCRVRGATNAGRSMVNGNGSTVPNTPVSAGAS